MILLGELGGKVGYCQVYRNPGAHAPGFRLLWPTFFTVQTIFTFSFLGFNIQHFSRRIIYYKWFANIQFS
jgi:hypothetical protein